MFIPVWEITVHQAVACDVYDGVVLCCPFLPTRCLDEILNLIESVSEEFPTYSCLPLHLHDVFPFLNGVVPRVTFYGVYISQLIRFARVSSHVDVFNSLKSRKENPQKLTQLSSRSHPRHLVGKRTAHNTDFTAKPLKQG